MVTVTIWLKNLAFVSPIGSTVDGQVAEVVLFLKQTSCVKTLSVLALVTDVNVLLAPLGTTATDKTFVVYKTGATFVTWAWVLTA